MAVTATPYTPFLIELVRGGHSFIGGDTYNVALLSPSYTPNFATHATFADVASAEVTGTGYTAGGQSLANIADGKSGVQSYVDADPIIWDPLTATARYAVIYQRAGSDNTVNRLVGLIDFGATRVYNAEKFQLSFPSHLLVVGVLP